MEKKIENGVLTISLEGELNSGNASSIEAELKKMMEEQPFQSLVLDFAHLVYISSAGLRVMLKLRQSCRDFSIINASFDVYQVFDMTGFTSMINIRKALKQVDVSKAQLIGEGYFSKVYRLDRDTIIKVFRFATDIAEVERELHLAKQAFILGIPTAISFDIVKVDGKFGVRFEMLDCKSLRDLIRDEPDNFEDYLHRYALLLQKIGLTESMSDELPDMKKVFLEKLDFVKGDFEAEEYGALSAFLSSIPDRTTFVHGDCHVKNIMVRDGEFFLIDMDTLSRGHPIFEYALLLCPYAIFEEDDPGNGLRFFGLPKETLQALWDGVAKSWLGEKYTKEALDQIRILAYIHMLWWNRKNEPENGKRFVGCKARLLALLKQYPFHVLSA